MGHKQLMEVGPFSTYILATTRDVSRRPTQKLLLTRRFKDSGSINSRPKFMALDTSFGA